MSPSEIKKLFTSYPSNYSSLAHYEYSYDTKNFPETLTHVYSLLQNKYIKTPHFTYINGDYPDSFYDSLYNKQI